MPVIGQALPTCVNIFRPASQAARSLSSLHFDRTEAYARVMKSADLQTLQTFAQACVKTGIANQAIDRLASEDRRHAQEAFALFSDKALEWDRERKRIADELTAAEQEAAEQRARQGGSEDPELPSFES